MCGIAGFIDPRGFNAKHAERVGKAMGWPLRTEDQMMQEFGLTLTTTFYLHTRDWQL